MERCLAGICNYSVWAECLAFRGCIPISPLLPPGEAQLPAPFTGKGWSQLTNMSIPVLISFVLFFRDFYPPSPPAMSKIWLLAGANKRRLKSIFFFQVLLDESLRLLANFSLSLTKCKSGVMWCMEQGHCPPSRIRFLKLSSRKAIVSKRKLLNSFNVGQ